MAWHEGSRALLAARVPDTRDPDGAGSPFPGFRESGRGRAAHPPPGGPAWRPVERDESILRPADLAVDDVLRPGAQIEHARETSIGRRPQRVEREVAPRYGDVVRPHEGIPGAAERRRVDRGRERVGRELEVRRL